MISQIPPQKYPSSEGTAKVHTFFELANLFEKKIKKRSPVGAGDDYLPTVPEPVEGRSANLT